MGFFKHLIDADTDAGRVRFRTSEQIYKDLHPEPEVKEVEKPGLLSRGWKFFDTIGSPSKALLGGLSKLGGAVKSYTQKARKEAIAEYTGTIDPLLYKNLVEKGKFDDIKNLRSLGLEVPKLIAKPIVERLPEERKELYRGNFIDGLKATGLTDDDIRQSVCENRFDKLLQEKHPNFEELSRKNQESIYEKLIDGMIISPPEEMTVDELMELATHADVKRSDIWGEMPGYIFVTNALRAFTSGWVDFSLEPETSRERVVGVVGDVAGIVLSLAVTGRALKGAVNYTKTGANFLKKCPYVSELLISAGAFNIHGQLNPDLEDDMNARLKTAAMDTTMAVGFFGVNSVFKGVAGMPVTGAVFGGLSALNGDSTEEIITNTIVGAALSGIGLISPKNYYALTSKRARSILTHEAKMKIDKGYSNERLTGVFNKAIENLDAKYDKLGINKKLSKEKKNELLDKYGVDLTKLQLAGEFLEKTPLNQRHFDDPVKLFKQTIKDFKIELSELTGRKIKPADIKHIPVTMAESVVPTRPRIIKTSKDGNAVIIGDMKFELGKYLVDDLMRTGQKGFDKRLAYLEKNLGRTRNMELRGQIIDRIEVLKAAGRQMGFIGSRATDILPERPEVAIAIPKPLAKVKGLSVFSIERVTEGLRDEIRGIKVPADRSKIIGRAVKEAFPDATPEELVMLKRVVGKTLRAAPEAIPTAVKEAVEVEKVVPKVKPKVKPKPKKPPVKREVAFVMPKVLKPLAKEARKYRNIKELINKFDLSIKEKPEYLFKGKGTSIQAQQLVRGIHLSDNLRVAKEFADFTRGVPIVHAYKLSPNAKIANLDQVKMFLAEKKQLADMNTITKTLKERGYAGAVGTLPGKGSEFIIINQRMIKDLNIPFKKIDDFYTQVVKRVEIPPKPIKPPTKPPVKPKVVPKIKPEVIAVQPQEYTEANLFTRLRKQQELPERYKELTSKYREANPDITRGMAREEIYKLFVRNQVDKTSEIRKKKVKKPVVLAREVAMAPTFNRAIDVLESPDVSPLRPGKPMVQTDARGRIDQYIKDKIVMAPFEKTRGKLSIRSTADRSWKWLMREIVDEFDVVVKAEASIDKGLVPQGHSPQMAWKRLLGVKATIDEMIEYRTKLRLEDGGTIVTGPGLQKIIKPFANVIEYLMALMYAQREIELGARPKKIKGIEKGEGKKIVNDLKEMFSAEDFKKLELGAKEIRQWGKKAILDQLLSVGAIDRELYDKISTSNKFWIPFFRLMDSIEQRGFINTKINYFTPKTIPLKRIFGSHKKIINPIEALIMNAYIVNSWVAQQRVIQDTVNLRLYSKDLAANIKRVTPKMVPVAVAERTAEIDKGFFDSLEKFAKELGLKAVVTKGKVGKRLGLYSSKLNTINRKFATSPKTAAHELGHFLDDLFDLRKRFYLKPLDTKAVGKEIYRFSEVQVGEKGARLQSPAERFANAFSWWLVHRNLAKEDIPLFTNTMPGIIKEIPALKGLLKIKPTPRPEIEVMIETIFRPSLFQAPNIVEAYKNGKKVYYEFTGDAVDIAKVLSSMRQSETNTLMRILGVPASMLRAGAVLTPEFSLARNPFRDILQASIYSKYGYKPLIDFATGLYQVVMKTNTYHEFRESGAEHSMLVSIDRINKRKNYNDMIGKGSKMTEYVGHPLEALRALSEFTEKANRVAEYRLAKKAGASIDERMFAGRDITLDFLRMGRTGRQLNMIIPFWNANVQDLSKMGREFRRQPGLRTMMAIMGLTLPTIALFMINKDDEMYWELPQWRRDFFFNIPIHGKIAGKRIEFLMWPKPFLLGAIFSTAPERTLSWVHHNDPAALTTLPEAIAMTTNPGWFPAMFKPIVEYAANYSMFRDRPIVSQSIQNLPPELQSASYTSETAKLIGQWIKKSPAKLENAFYGYTAGLGRMGLDASDWLLERFGIVSPPPAPTKELGDIPLIRAVVPRTPTGSGSESVNRFYEILNEARATDEAMELMMKEGKMEKYEEYLEDNPNVRYLKGLERIARDFSAIRQRLNIIYDSEELTSEEKREAINALNQTMTEMASQVLTLIKESK